MGWQNMFLWVAEVKWEFRNHFFPVRRSTRVFSGRKNSWGPVNGKLRAGCQTGDSRGLGEEKDDASMHHQKFQVNAAETPIFSMSFTRGPL